MNGAKFLYICKMGVWVGLGVDGKECIDGEGLELAVFPPLLSLLIILGEEVCHF